MKFCIENFFSKCEQIHNFVNLFTFDKEVPSGTLHFLCNQIYKRLTVTLNRFVFTKFADQKFSKKFPIVLIQEKMEQKTFYLDQFSPAKKIVFSEESLQ